MSVLFAAAHPDRVTSLVLYGAMGRTTEAPDYPWASSAEALRQSADEFIVPYWGQQADGMVELFAPSFSGDPRAAEFTARMERSAASPAMVRKIFEMFLDIDVRAVLPTIHVPTLVLHRHGDRVVNRRAGQDLASQIPGARYVELPGIDHQPWAGDSDAVLGEIEEFLTGARSLPEPDRVLATVMFTDIVGSTNAPPSSATLAGARCWRRTMPPSAASWTGSAGREVKTLGRRLPRHVRRPGARDQVRAGDTRRGASARTRGSRRSAHGRGGADGRRRRRHRGPHCRPGRRPGRTRRGAGVEHHPRSRGRIRDRFRRPRVPVPSGIADDWRLFAVGS